MRSLVLIVTLLHMVCDSYTYGTSKLDRSEFSRSQKKGAIGISVGSQASVMLDLGLILERIFTL